MTDSPLPPPTEAMPVMQSPEDSLLPRPWYKKPLGIGMLVVGALLLAGLIFGLVWASGDDDAEVVAARVVLLPKDSAGAGLDRPFFADVTGTSEFPSSFVFLEPGTFPGDGGISGSSAGSGRMEFAWAPTSEVVEPEIWTSTIAIVGSSPVGFTPPGPVVECVLARLDEQNTTVSMDVVVDPPDPLVEQEVIYTFTNHEFLPGDTVTCELVSLELPPETTTTVPETTVPETTIPETTVPETTVPETTVPETTVPETTVPETTVPETTVPETTVPETTTPETTVAPPAAPATAAEALQAAGNYATFLNLASAVPSVQALLDGTAPITVFAPNDAAFGGITPPADPAELEQLLLSHIVSGEALDAASLFDGSRTDVTMASGGTQPIVQDPATVGGATVVEADLASTNAWSHGIDTVFSTTP